MIYWDWSWSKPQLIFVKSILMRNQVVSDRKSTVQLLVLIISEIFFRDPQVCLANMASMCRRFFQEIDLFLADRSTFLLQALIDSNTCKKIIKKLKNRERGSEEILIILATIVKLHHSILTTQETLILIAHKIPKIVGIQKRLKNVNRQFTTNCLLTSTMGSKRLITKVSLFLNN
jgi:hypothetical protein